MKVASVDRIGSWRPPNADARAVTASRLQTIAAGTANSVEPQALNSGTELPPLPVQKTQDAMARPVLQSDKPVLVPQALNGSGVETANNAPVPTVEAFRSSASKPTDDQQGDASRQKSESSSASKSLLELELAKQNPDNLTSLEIATQAAAERAAKQAKKEAAQPPKEPLSKMLMDQVKSLWDASSKAVEASLSTDPPVANPSPDVPPSGAGTSTDITYTVPRHGSASR